MSFIDLRLIVEDGITRNFLNPTDVLCPVMSAVSVSQAPMAAELSLSLKSVICLKEKCGMYAHCANIPARAP